MDNKITVVNNFIRMCEMAMDFEVPMQINIWNDGLSLCFNDLVDNIYVHNDVVAIESKKGEMDILLKKYEVNIIESEGVLILQFESGHNKIQISF